MAETAAVGDPTWARSGCGHAVVGRRLDTDILTYGLSAVEQDDIDGITDVTLPSGDGTGPGDDLAAFDIDKATGQITVAQKLDFESRGPDVGDMNGKYVVVATVTDPSADLDASPTTGYDFIVVVITAERQ